MMTKNTQNTISLISAMNQDRVIGQDNKMPWHITEELQYFKQITMGKPMIMGRTTFDAIGRRLLPGRTTIILTKDKTLQTLESKQLKIAHSIEQALQHAHNVVNDTKEIMIVGGAKIYQQFLPLANKIYLSIIKQHGPGDTFFPEFEENNLTKWQVDIALDHPEFLAKIYQKI